ncbi:MAG: hypothetical protein L0Y74_08860 [candidate division Zixibacteria bacterium]|nr:hypothetical protein [candidate division Zixibacteria bacterium]MCI0532041.1 hypothetical protein [candidate division Zixibacteria bacterium]
MFSKRKILKKLDQLIEEGNQIISQGRREVKYRLRVAAVSGLTTRGIGEPLRQRSATYEKEDADNSYFTGKNIINSLHDLNQFGVSSLNLLRIYTGGETSEFYLNFKRHWDLLVSQNPIYTDSFGSLIGVLKAAKREISAGFSVPLEAQIASEVYKGFLDQAEDYFKSKDYGSAAILAGAALEQGLKKIAKLKKVTLTGKKSVLIAHDLVKAMVITELEKKKIEQWNEIHNKAEHEPGVFKRMLKTNKNDIEQVTQEVKTFLKRYLT